MAGTDANCSTPSPAAKFAGLGGAAGAAGTSSASRAAGRARPAVLVVLSCEQQLTSSVFSDDVSSSSPDISPPRLSSVSSYSYKSSSRRRCYPCGAGGRGRHATESAEFLAEAGISLSSLLAIHYVFENAGVIYRIATPTGRPPAVSNVAAAPAAAAATGAVGTSGGTSAAIVAALEKNVPATLYEQLRHPLPLRNVNTSEFQGLLLPHHLGAALDLLHSSALAKLVAAALPPPLNKTRNTKKSFFSARGSRYDGKDNNQPLVVCAIGYGAYALCAKRQSPADATATGSYEKEDAQYHRWTPEPRTPSSESPFDGYVLTSVSPFDECRYPFFGQLPYMVQEILEDNGASFVSFTHALDSPACVIDRNLVTGPSEASTQLCLQVFTLLLLNAAASRTAATHVTTVADDAPAIAAAGAAAAAHAISVSAAHHVPPAAAVVSVNTPSAKNRQHPQLLAVLPQQQPRHQEGQQKLLVTPQQQLVGTNGDKQGVSLEQPVKQQRDSPLQLQQQESMRYGQIVQQPSQPSQQQQQQVVGLQQHQAVTQQQQTLFEQQPHLTQGMQQQPLQQQQQLSQQQEHSNPQQPWQQQQQQQQPSQERQPCTSQQHQQEPQRQTLDSSYREISSVNEGLFSAEQKRESGVFRATESVNHSSSFPAAAAESKTPTATTAAPLSRSHETEESSGALLGRGSEFHEGNSATGAASAVLRISARVACTTRNSDVEDGDKERVDLPPSSTLLLAKQSAPTATCTAVEEQNDGARLHANTGREFSVPYADGRYTAAGDAVNAVKPGDAADPQYNAEKAATHARDGLDGSCIISSNSSLSQVAAGYAHTDSAESVNLGNDGAVSNGADTECTSHIAQAEPSATMTVDAKADGRNGSRSPSSPRADDLLFSISQRARQSTNGEAGSNRSSGRGGMQLTKSTATASGPNLCQPSHTCGGGFSSEGDSSKTRGRDARTGGRSATRPSTPSHQNPFSKDTQRECTANNTMSSTMHAADIAVVTSDTEDIASSAVSTSAAGGARAGGNNTPNASAAKATLSIYSSSTSSSTSSRTRGAASATTSHMMEGFSDFVSAPSSHICSSGLPEASSVRSKGVQNCDSVSDQSNTEETNPESTFSEKSATPFIETRRDVALSACGIQQNGPIDASCHRPAHPHRAIRNTEERLSQEKAVADRHTVAVEGASDNGADVRRSGPFIFPRSVVALRRSSLADDVTREETTLRNTSPSSAAGNAICGSQTDCTGPIAPGDTVRREAGVVYSDSAAVTSVLPGGARNAVAAYCAHAAADGKTGIKTVSADADCEVKSNIHAFPAIDGAWPGCTARHTLSVETDRTGKVADGVGSDDQPSRSKSFYSLNETSDCITQITDATTDGNYSSSPGYMDSGSYWRQPKGQQQEQEHQQRRACASAAGGNPLNAAASEALSSSSVRLSANSVVDVADAVGDASHTSKSYDEAVTDAVLADVTCTGLLITARQISKSAGKVTDQLAPRANESSNDEPYNVVGPPPQSRDDSASGDLSGVFPFHEDRCGAPADAVLHTRSSAEQGSFLDQRAKSGPPVHGKEKEQQQGDQRVLLQQHQRFRHSVAQECQGDIDFDSKATSNESTLYPSPNNVDAGSSHGKAPGYSAEVSKEEASAQCRTAALAGQDVLASHDDDAFGSFVANTGAAVTSTDWPSLGVVTASERTPRVNKETSATGFTVGTGSTVPADPTEKVTAADFERAFPSARSALLPEGFASGSTFRQRTESHLLSASRGSTQVKERPVRTATTIEQDPFSRGDWLHWQ